MGATERNEVARAAWRDLRGYLPVNDLIFVDECGSNIALTPLYARAPRGQRASGSAPRNWGKNTTLVAGLSLAGIRAPMILEGAVETLAFETYVEQVLAPSLQPGRIVVLDNLSAHRGERGRQAIEAKGSRVLFLPAYSPDLTPIKEAFSKLKAWLGAWERAPARRWRRPSPKRWSRSPRKMRTAGFGTATICRRSLARGAQMKCQLDSSILLRTTVEGPVQPHHAFLLTCLLAQIDFLKEPLAQVQREIEQRLEPCAEAMTLVQGLAGLQATTASGTLAERGVQMERFPVFHACGFVGRRLSRQQTKWGQALEWQDDARQSLSPGGAGGGGLGAQPHQRHLSLGPISSHCPPPGKQKAVIAVAHSVLVILYHMLREGRPYTDLGPDYFERLEATRIERHHVRRLEQLGYTVTLTPAPAA